jgi:guanosine-3',5'-bis(diphosphate) 3'-pyrophosphohydrolase
MIVLENGGSVEQINAALLHDTLEDTDTSSLELKTLFGEKVANMVWELTNSRIKIDEIGKDSYMSEKLKSISEEALLVKLADMLYNINDQPTSKAFERMLDNVKDVILARPLNDETKKLATEVFNS